MDFKLESIGSFIWGIESAAFHHLKEASYRRKVFQEVTKKICPNRDVMLFLLFVNKIIL